MSNTQLMLTEEEIRAEIELSSAHQRLNTAYQRNNREDIKSALMDIEIAKGILKTFNMNKKDAALALSKAHENLSAAYLKSNSADVRRALDDIENAKNAMSRFVRDRNPLAMRDALRAVESL